MSTPHGDSTGRLTIDDVRREERGTSGGRWVVSLDGHEAEMTYSRASAALIIIDHTGVPDALRGRGVGQVLVRRAVEDARREGFRILPLCPFAKGQFERHPDWRDVLSA
jgi:predicted GNAT family acetyltransferase